MSHYCDCDYCDYEDEYVPPLYDPNHVWHGPRTRMEQFRSDAYDGLIEHLLKPTLFFDRLAGTPSDGKTVTFQVVSSELL